MGIKIKMQERTGHIGKCYCDYYLRKEKSTKHYVPENNIKQTVMKQSSNQPGRSQV